MTTTSHKTLTLSWEAHECVWFYGNSSSSCWSISLKTTNVNLNVRTKFDGNLSHSCWGISVWTKVVERPMDTAIPRAMPLALLKIHTCFQSQSCGRGLQWIFAYWIKNYSKKKHQRRDEAGNKSLIWQCKITLSQRATQKIGVQTVFGGFVIPQH